MKSLYIDAMKLLSDFATNMYLVKDATAKYVIGHDDPSVKIRYSKARFA